MVVDCGGMDSLVYEVGLPLWLWIVEGWTLWSMSWSAFVVGNCTVVQSQSVQVVWNVPEFWHSAH